MKKDTVHLRAREVSPERPGEGCTLRTPWSEFLAHRRMWGSPTAGLCRTEPTTPGGFLGLERGRRRAWRPGRGLRQTWLLRPGQHTRGAPDPLLPPGAAPGARGVLPNAAPGGSRIPSAPAPGPTGHRLGSSFTSSGGGPAVSFPDSESTQPGCFISTPSSQPV